MSFEYVKNFDRLQATFSAAAATDAIGLDTETCRARGPEGAHFENIYNEADDGYGAFDPFTSEVRLVQFRGRGLGAVVVDLWALSPEARTWFAQAIAGYTGVFIVHNWRFDARHIFKTLGVWLDEKATTFCTMQASILMANSVGTSRGERKNTLAACCRDFLGVDVDKTEQNSNWGEVGLSAEQLEYAALDVAYLHELHDLMKAALENPRTFNQPEPLRLDMAVLGPTARMEHAGMPFCPKYYQFAQEAAAKNLPQLAEAFGIVVGEELKKHGATIGYVPQTFLVPDAKGGTIAVQATVPTYKGKVGPELIRANKRLLEIFKEVEDLLDEEGNALTKTERALLEPLCKEHPFLDLLLKYKDLEKQSQFKLIKYQHPITKRIHAKFQPGGASTGRYSCVLPNLQQIPAKHELIHPSGMKLTYRDVFSLRGSDHLVSACIHEDSLLTTERGLVRARDIRLGDAVLTSKGVHPVTAIQPNHKPVNVVKTSLGFELKVTDEHPLMVIQESGLPAWARADALAPGDWVVLRKGALKFDPGIQDLPPLTDFVDNHHTSQKALDWLVSGPVKLDVEMAEFLGRFVADGCTTGVRESGRKGKSSMALGDDEAELAGWLVDFCLRRFGKAPTDRGRGDWTIESVAIAAWLQAVTGKTNSGDAKVPEAIFRSSLVVQAAFLRGLYDGDGYTSSRPRQRCISLTSKSVQLIQDVQLLLLHQGILARRRKVEAVTNFGPFSGECLTVCELKSFEAFARKIGFITSTKKANLANCLSGQATSKPRNYTDLAPASVLHNSFQGKQVGTFNNLMGNSRRNGVVTPEALNKHVALQPGWFNLGHEGLRMALSDTYAFDQVESVTPVEGKELVFDYTVDVEHCFVANGVICKNCDFASQELLVMALLSGDPIMIKALNEGADLHSEVAAGMFGIDPKDARNKVPGKDKTYRDYGKVLMYCVAGDARVATKRGQVPIRDVQVGDEVYSGTAWRKVLDHWSSGVKKVVTLKDTRFGFSLKVTPEHRMKVQDENGRLRFRRVRDLEQGDLLLTCPGLAPGGDGQTFPAYTGWEVIDEGKEVETFDITVDVDHVFVAEGLVTHNSLAYGKSEQGFATQWKMALDEVKKLVQGFKNRFPRLAAFLDREGNLGALRSFSRLVNGAVRFVGGSGSVSGARRQSANYQIQGLSAWSTRVAMIVADELIRASGRDIQLNAQIHDEILFVHRVHPECPYGIFCKEKDPEQLQLGKDFKAGKLDKNGYKAALEEREGVLRNRCEDECGEHRDCATWTEKLITKAMTAGAEYALKGVVHPPEGYSSCGTRQYWVK